MDTILTSIQQKIANELPKFNYVDENWGQLEYYGSEIPVKWPCVLISLRNASYTNTGRDFGKSPANRQEGKIIVELTIADLKLTNTSFRATMSQKNNAFEIHKLIKELHEIVHGWKPTDNSGSLIRTNVNETQRDDGVQQYSIGYSLDVYDC